MAMQILYRDGTEAWLRKEKERRIKTREENLSEAENGKGEKSQQKNNMIYG